MTQKGKKKKKKLPRRKDIHTKRVWGGDGRLHRSTCLLEGKDEGNRKERQMWKVKRSRGFGRPRPVITCVGEEGGWFISWAAELHFEWWQNGACGRRRGLPSARPSVRPSVEMESQALACSRDELEVTQQGLTPKGRWLERQTYSFFRLFLMF